MPHSRRSVAVDGASSDEEQRPSKRSKPDAILGTSRAEENDALTSEQQQVVSDVTAVALDEGMNSGGAAASYRSAFGSVTPAKPPAAQPSWGSSSSRSTMASPRQLPASSASARQWKMTQTQRHADSLAFFSRDQVHSQGDMPDSSVGGMPDYAIRLDSFEKTGSLMWLQAKCLDQKERVPDGRWIMEARTFGHTWIDGAGRQRGQHRVLSSYGSYDDDSDYEDFDSDVVKPQHFLPRSSIGLTPHAHSAFSSSPLYDVVQYDFDCESTSLPRGLAMTPYDFPPDVDGPFLNTFGQWTTYDRPNMFTTLSTPVRPSLHPCDACERMWSILKKHPGPKGIDERRGDELNLTVTLMETQAGLFFDEIDLAPVWVDFPRVPILPHHRFSSIAINEGTGHCWLGHLDGKVEYVDMLWWCHANYLTCPQWDDENSEEHGSCCTCSMEPIEPEEVLPASEERGAVTNFVSVGGCEVVVAFSNGSVILLELGKRLKISKTRDFVGHVNEGARHDDGGTNHVEMTVHSASRLMAIRGSDGQMRVWHLDDPYPLNSAWHRPRLPGRLAAPLDLLTQSPKQHEETTSQRAEPQQASSAIAATPGMENDDDDDTWDRLATQKVEEASFAELQGKRLSSLHASSFCSMTWTSTSWLADRDGQWELSRQFNDEGRPKVVSAGPLPGLVVCSDRPAGTTFLYFEPERRVGVEDVEVAEGQKRARAAMVGYEGVEGLD